MQTSLRILLALHPSESTILLSPQALSYFVADLNKKITMDNELAHNIGALKQTNFFQKETISACSNNSLDLKQREASKANGHVNHRS